jgi:hypothetical protein
MQAHRSEWTASSWTEAAVGGHRGHCAKPLATASWRLMTAHLGADWAAPDAHRRDPLSDDLRNALVKIRTDDAHYLSQVGADSHQKSEHDERATPNRWDFNIAAD